jgi:light-regulated signal transduction histidine kinase (bacteriophytochrome)
MVIKPTDLNAVVRDVTFSLTYLISEKQADIRIPKPLPAVLCDSVRIHEVYINLISNAVKYNDKPNRRVEIGYENNHNSPFVTLFVRDNGIGIKDQHMEKIFQIFQRLHSQKTYAGTGVGLTISKKIIERHGGKLWAESVFSEGSTFYFTLLRGKHGASDSGH